MFLNTLLGAFAALAIVITLWSVAVAFSPRTAEPVRKLAMDVFHVAWKTAIVSVLAALIRFYTSGLLSSGVSPASP